MITYLSFSVLLVSSGIIYLQTSTNIDVGELSTGNYILKINKGVGLETKKIIKL